MLDMSGQEFKKAISELGITMTEFSRAADMSVPTLNKIFDGEHVRDTTRNKALNAYRRLRTQVEGPPLPVARKAAG